MVITEDQQFLHHFQNGVDGGCQAFIVQGESTVFEFLDAFFEVHELSEQRTSSKKLIAVVENFDSIERICNHSAITELPDVLFVVWREKDSDVQLFTTESFSDGSRGSKIIRIVPVADDNYFPEKGADLKGVPIRMRTLDYPPFSYYEETTPDKANARYDPQYGTPDTPLLVDGQEPLILVEFCRLYNCTIEAFFDEDELWGEVFENHTGTGMLGAVLRREADYAVAAIYCWEEPYKFVTYTAPLSRSGITVLVPKPQLLAPWRTPLLSFSSMLWLAVGAAFCLGIFAVWISDGIRVRVTGSNGQAKTFSDSVLVLTGFFMEQGSDMHNDLTSSIFLYSTLLFAGFMIGNMYGAGLASTMTIPQYEKPIDTTYDLAASGMLWAATAINWILSIMTSTQPHLQTLVQNYRILDTEELIRHRTKRDLGYVGERSEFDHFSPVDFLDEESSLLLQLLKDDLFWQTCIAAITKTWPFKERLNDLIMRVDQSGIQYYWEAQTVVRYMNTKIQRNLLYSRQMETEGEAEVLTVSHFLGAFMILGFGSTFGTAVFVLEKFVNYKIKSSNK
ncbi:glutamate receptor-like [Culex pipiens pallens]|uniref:glutamate receptor-like n=1 Tax=Culex pipiens pallens TaxID=42434 RepID=UPI0019537DFE|nr:glutamate receptor-like [Culex pipiens pallens]